MVGMAGLLKLFITVHCPVCISTLKSPKKPDHPRDQLLCMHTHHLPDQIPFSVSLIPHVLLPPARDTSRGVKDRHNDRGVEVKCTNQNNTFFLWTCNDVKHNCIIIFVTSYMQSKMHKLVPPLLILIKYLKL